LSETLSWHWLTFEQLTVYQLHDLMALRTDVFVVEQNCVYHELDGRDKACYHLLGMDASEELVAYCRVLPPGLVYPEVAFGRVLIRESHRGQGLGRTLMEQTMHYLINTFGKVPVHIAAQDYLESFYQSFGFKTTSPVFLDDGIPHIEMLFSPTSSE